MRSASTVLFSVLLLVISVSAGACFDSGGSSSSVGTFPDGETLTFCHFGPKMKVLDPVTSSDHCSGTAKIQGVLWECGQPDLATTSADSMRAKLAEEAAEECSRHCEARTSGCQGVLVPVSHCGLSTDHDDAVVLGKRFGCSKSCSGPGFLYCSLYNAGFRTDDPERIHHQAPNCRCIPGS